MYYSASPQEAAKLLASNEYILLDCRESHEWAAGHITGAIHIPLSKLRSDSASLKVVLDTSNLEIRNKLIFYCQSGNRSKQACAIAEKLGYNEVHNLTGGIQAWKKVM